MFFGPGCLLICNMYFCKFNLFWVIYDYTRVKMTPFSINYKIDQTLIVFFFIIFKFIKSNQYFFFQLLVNIIEAHDRPGYYFNEYTSYVADPNNLLNKKAKEKNKKIFNCWNEVKKKDGYEVWIKKIDQNTKHSMIDEVNFIIDLVPQFQPPCF